MECCSLLKSMLQKPNFPVLSEQFGTHPRIRRIRRIKCQEPRLGTCLPRAPGVRMTWVLNKVPQIRWMDRLYPHRSRIYCVKFHGFCCKDHRCCKAGFWKILPDVQKMSGGSFGAVARKFKTKCPRGFGHEKKCLNNVPRHFYNIFQTFSYP